MACYQIALVQFLGEHLGGVWFLGAARVRKIFLALSSTLVGWPAMFLPPLIGLRFGLLQKWELRRSFSDHVVANAEVVIWHALCGLESNKE